MEIKTSRLRMFEIVRAWVTRTNRICSDLKNGMINSEEGLESFERAIESGRAKIEEIKAGKENA